MVKSGNLSFLIKSALFYGRKIFDKHLRNESIELEFLSKYTFLDIGINIIPTFFIVDGNQLFRAFDNNLNVILIRLWKTHFLELLTPQT